MSGANSAVEAKETDCTSAVARVLVIGKDQQLGQPFEKCLAAHNCEFDYAHGSADARPDRLVQVMRDQQQREFHKPRREFIRYRGGGGISRCRCEDREAADDGQSPD